MTNLNTENQKETNFEIIHAKHFDTRLQISKEFIQRTNQFAYKLRLYAVAGSDWFLIKSWLAKVSELEIIAYYHGYSTIEQFLNEHITEKDL